MLVGTFSLGGPGLHDALRVGALRAPRLLLGQGTKAAGAGASELGCPVHPVAFTFHQKPLSSQRPRLPSGALQCPSWAVRAVRVLRAPRGGQRSPPKAPSSWSAKAACPPPAELGLHLPASRGPSGLGPPGRGLSAGSAIKDSELPPSGPLCIQASQSVQGQPGPSAPSRAGSCGWGRTWDGRHAVPGLWAAGLGVWGAQKPTATAGQGGRVCGSRGLVSTEFSRPGHRGPPRALPSQQAPPTQAGGPPWRAPFLAVGGTPESALACKPSGRWTGAGGCSGQCPAAC